MIKKTISTTILSAALMLPSLALAATTTTANNGYGGSRYWGMMGMMRGYGPAGGWSGTNYGYNMMNGYGFGGWAGALMILLLVLIAAGLIFLLVMLAKRNSKMANNNSAIEIIKERYAKGEISKEEFEEKKKELS